MSFFGILSLEFIISSFPSSHHFLHFYLALFFGRTLVFTFGSCLLHSEIVEQIASSYLGEGFGQKLTMEKSPT